ncbi:ATP-binding protein [Candidatus Roizmanbacteria bacterium]|nr:ATP-binding protein [Candidatus Roizmanbacteria bacterium]
MVKRYLEDIIIADLKEKMVFVAGPRQVGKTTMAKQIGERSLNPFAYLNWDFQPDRRDIINLQFKGDAKLLVFDELHKYKQWKNYLKGVYDKYKNTYKIMLTGSSRLDIYQKGGDSLRGRYFYHVLHPFSLAEVLKLKPIVKPFQELEFSSTKASWEAFSGLFQFGPFPEPFLKQSASFLRRWRLAETDRLVKEEIRDLRMIADLSTMQILVEILPIKVGSPLSSNNLREDLQVAHKTIVNYLNILELFYFHFRIYPYARKPIRSLKKMPKLYLWDWSPLANDGAKLENVVASHLLKFINYLTHTQGYKTELWYLRDVEGREVDFLVTVDSRPWFAVESKITDENNLSTLSYFKKRINIPFVYGVVLKEQVDYRRDDVRVISVDKFLSGLI